MLNETDYSLPAMRARVVERIARRRRVAWQEYQEAKRDCEAFTAASARYFRARENGYINPEILTR